MKRVQRAVVGCIVMGLTACGASSASAETVTGYSGSGYGSTLDVGQTLQIDVKPANSGSSGYHWRVAKRPKGSVLRLVSRHAVRNPARQRFTFQTSGAGVTSFKLQYVSPGRHPRVAKTYRHTVAVNKLLPQLDCFGSGRSTSLVAQTSAARVFGVNRTIRAFVFGSKTVERVSYEVFLGCADAEGHAHELGTPQAEAGLGSHATPADVYDVTLRGTVAGYAFKPACPIVIQSSFGCGFTSATAVVAQDLNGGKLIRAEGVGTSGPDDENRLTGLVVSASGGLAWSELGHDGATNVGIVLRSDEQPDQSGPFDVAQLDFGADVDPNSLLFDGTNVSWQKGGKTQHARLR